MEITLFKWDVSVSYTHLDVYKRQVYAQGTFVDAVVFRVQTRYIERTAGDTVAAADALLGLEVDNADVYKRQAACWWFRNLRWRPIPSGGCDRASRKALPLTALRRCMSISSPAVRCV